MITTINGEQLLIWPFRPSEPLQESMQWVTDVLQPFGAEQRISLRSKPRQTWSYQHLMTKRQHARAKSFVKLWAANVFAVPIWSESTVAGAVSASATEILFDTGYADYRDGGIALVWDNDESFEVVEIDTVLADRITLTGTVQNSYTRAYVAPIRRCRMPNLPMDSNRGPGLTTQTTVNFFVLDTVDLSADATPFAVHDGFQVLEDRPLLQDSAPHAIIWDQQVFDNQTGVIAVDTLQAIPKESQVAAWNTVCGRRMWDIRTWLHSMRGRFKAFWMPSYQADMVLASPIGASDTTITINDIGFSTYYITAEIMILLKDGARYYRSVTGSVDNGATEDLTIAALGSAVAIADVDIISIMTLSRLDADRVEITHRSNSGAALRVPVVEVDVPV